MAGALLHGDEEVAFGDAGIKGPYEVAKTAASGAESSGQAAQPNVLKS